MFTAGGCVQADVGRLTYIADNDNDGLRNIEDMGELPGALS